MNPSSELMLKIQSNSKFFQLVSNPKQQSTIFQQGTVFYSLPKAEANSHELILMINDHFSVRSGLSLLTQIIL